MATARSAAEAAVWVDQASSASADLRGRATAAAAQAWLAFTAWYDAAAVAKQAREVAELSTAGQQTATGLYAAYVGHVTAAIADTPRIPVPQVLWQPVRNGVDPVVVHSRPAYTFKDTFATTGDEELAIQRAVVRGMRLIEADLMLAGRQAQVDAMAELKVERYRRVLRPELSQDGPCGLCVVAANQVYSRGDLMPLHDLDKCETISLIGAVGGDGDPGLALNREDLDAIYEVAGSTNAKDLKRTRIAISEHGELGPVLRVKGHRFTGADDLGGPLDPQLAQKRLAALQTVLDQLKQADKAGQNVDDRLAFQQGAIARTTAQLSA